MPDEATAGPWLPHPTELWKPNDPERGADGHAVPSCRPDEGIIHSHGQEGASRHAQTGSEIRDWAVDHRADVATLLIVAAVVLPILLAIARLGRRLENRVRSIARTAGPTMPSMATLLSMTLLGPALSWPLFRLLGYSGRSVYALTLAAAPVFGAVWVPAYGLGVWSLIEGLF